MKLMNVTFDEFLKATLGEGYGEEKLSLKVLDAVAKLDVLWDWDADPYDFPDYPRGLTILDDGKVVVVGTIPGMRGGSCYCCWTGYLK